MSQHQAALRIRSAVPRPAMPTRDRLRLVAPIRSRAKRAPFVVVLLSVLAVGLVGLILISTALQAQAFRLSELQQQNKALLVQKQELERQVDVLRSPATIASQALSLGMVPNTNPSFLRLSDGAVVGKPTPAKSGTNVRRVER